MLITLIFIALAYAIGSLSSAIIVSKLKKLPDPREHGSGNAGATNVLRTGDKTAAMLVVFGDFFKGWLAVAIASAFGVTGLGLGLVAVAAVVGHIFPVFFQFKGGKGVATALGSLLCLYWVLAVVIAVIWLGVAFFTRYASLASICAAASAIIFALVLRPFPYEFPVILLAGLIIYKHYPNILRLLDHSESKINFSKSKGS